MKQNELEKQLEEVVKKQCNEFISKMKNELLVDCLDLGRVAACTYGREKGNDWNEIVKNSKIEVNVKVKIRGQGRGGI